MPAQPKRVVSIGLEDMLLSLEVPLVQVHGMEGYYLYDRLREKTFLRFTRSAGSTTKPSWPCSRT